MIATVISGTIGVTLALNGFGAWSLVTQSLSSNLFRTALLWLFNTGRPSLTFSFVSLRSIFAFGLRLMASGPLDTIFQHIYFLVIGRVYSALTLVRYDLNRAMIQP